MRTFRPFCLLTALLFVLLSLVACSTGGVNKTVNPTVVPTQKTDGGPGPDIQTMAFQPADSIKPAVSQALSAFSLDLFQRMTSSDKNKNVFVSPLSVWLALSMTYNGASGSTAEGMAKALHASGVLLEDLNADNAGLMGVLAAADPKNEIAIANSIWMRKGLASAFNQDFLDRDRQYYGARIEALDFNDEAAAGIMNKWVEDNTNGNIKGIVQPPISADTVMFLINAVHFKAPWKQAFNPKETLEKPFTLADGSQVTASYLFRKKDNLGYADDSVTAARIPYASGRLELVAILPQQQSLAEYVKALTPVELDDVIGKCGDTSIPLFFPKFKLEYEIKLNDTLKAMGMEQAFADGADFSAMSKDIGKQLVISRVMHKSFIELNEEGTEASAVTSLEMEVTSAMPDPKILEFNRPFLYLIRDSRTGAILFMGTMEDPS